MEADLPRDPWDRYYTPDSVADACLQHSTLLGKVPTNGTVLDLGSGGGSWARAVKLLRPDVQVLGVDIDLDARGALFCDDWLTADVVEERQKVRAWLAGRWPSLTVANPPFQHAMTFVDVAMDLSPKAAFLMRSAMVESAKRFHFWQSSPLVRDTTLVERIPFLPAGEQTYKAGGTDNAPCSLFEWDELYEGLPTRDILSWKRYRRSAFSGTVLVDRRADESPPRRRAG